MAVPDNDILDWKADFTGDDTNPPRDSDEIDTNLGDEVRNIKSVVRREAGRKTWLAMDFPITTIDATAPSFTVAGDQSKYFSPGRWVMIHAPSGVGYSFFPVKSVVFAATVTTVTLHLPFDFKGLMPTDTPFITRFNDDVLTAPTDVSAAYAAGKKLILIDTTTGFTYVKKIESSFWDTITTVITCFADSVAIPGTSYLFLEGANSLFPTDADRAYPATFDSDPATTGMVHVSQAGQVKLTTSTTVTFPKPEADTEYTVVLTMALRPTSGDDYESLLFVQNKTILGFNVAFRIAPSSGSGSGGPDTIDWILVRHIQPASNCNLDGG